MWQFSLWRIFGWFKPGFVFKDPSFIWSSFGMTDALELCGSGGWAEGGALGICRWRVRLTLFNQPGTSRDYQCKWWAGGVAPNLESCPPGPCSKSWLTVSVQKHGVPESWLQLWFSLQAWVNKLHGPGEEGIQKHCLCSTGVSVQPLRLAEPYGLCLSSSVRRKSSVYELG